MNKTIIIDIDNTIVDQIPRKLKILESLDIRNVSETDIHKDYALKSLLLGSNRGAFLRLVLGSDLQEYITAFPDAPRYINELSKDYHIIYLSARPSI
jgi:hypothetical protein